jgi:hypothetical protein
MESKDSTIVSYQPEKNTRTREHLLSDTSAAMCIDDIERLCEGDLSLNYPNKIARLA